VLSSWLQTRLSQIGRLNLPVRPVVRDAGSLRKFQPLHPSSGPFRSLPIRVRWGTGRDLHCVVQFPWQVDNGFACISFDRIAASGIQRGFLMASRAGRAALALS